MEQLDAFAPPHKPAARRLTLLLNLSAHQVADLEQCTAGPVHPVGDRWRRLETLIRRGFVVAGPCAWEAAAVTLSLTEFGKCALAAYRAAEAAGFLKEVA